VPTRDCGSGLPIRQDRRCVRVGGDVAGDIRIRLRIDGLPIGFPDDLGDQVGAVMAGVISRKPYAFLLLADHGVSLILGRTEIIRQVPPRHAAEPT
jgi:hypothetical protein